RACDAIARPDQDNVEPAAPGIPHQLPEPPSPGRLAFTPLIRSCIRARPDGHAGQPADGDRGVGFQGVDRPN
ncbi:MAG TPA: hypothetical protein VL135_10360, partial [Terracidiphilus sp.]|nr:hypothetical protein [Terracidiphilus sp.]